MKISSNIIIKNTLLNILGFSIPIGIAFASIPTIILFYGNDLFGILTLIWAIINYFIIFDLGLGKATTKFISESLGSKKYNDIKQTFYTTIITQLILGLFGGLALFLLSNNLVEILNIPNSIYSDTVKSFKYLSISIPFILISGSLRGTLEAFQRFDLVNIIRIPSSSVIYIAPLFGLYFSFSLSGIIIIIVLSRIIIAIVQFILSRRLLPKTNSNSYFDKHTLKTLLKFGGWLTISIILSPILLYIDRFIITHYAGVSELPYYSVPFEITLRLMIIPASLVATLFPLLSTIQGMNVQKSHIINLLSKNTNYLSFIMFFVTIIIIGLGKLFLNVWVGNEYATKSWIILDLLTFGFFFNSMATIPYYFIQSVGRTDITAKIHLIETPIFLLILFFLL